MEAWCSCNLVPLVVVSATDYAVLPFLYFFLLVAGNYFGTNVVLLNRSDPDVTCFLMFHRASIECLYLRGRIVARVPIRLTMVAAPPQRVPAQCCS